MIKFDLVNNTKSDIVKAVGTAVGVAVPLMVAAFADSALSTQETVGILAAFTLSVLASLGLYHSEPESPTTDSDIPPVGGPGVPVA